MRRTDRLFEIMQLFRGGRHWRGCDIAERLEVSLRTIYRDIDTLVTSGVPIEGERGVGYMLREPIFLPPLTLTVTELEALHLGMKIVCNKADRELADAAARLLEKVDAVLPSDRQGQSFPADISVYVGDALQANQYLGLLRRGISKKQVLEIEYDSLGGNETTRLIQPLQVEYWGQVWTCTAWCRLRGDFRVFRVDRISACRETGEKFSNEPGKTYRNYLEQFEEPEK